MNRTSIVDTGPLVALLDVRDQHHEWAMTQFDALALPPITCEAVVSEVVFLLNSRADVVRKFLEILQRGEVVIRFRLEAELARVSELIRRYQNIPMSLADACLVRMAELFTVSQVITLDSDFHTYRKHGRQVIPCLMPES